MKALKTLLLVLVTLNLLADDPNGLRVGDYAPGFSLKNIDGTMVALTDYSEAKGFVVIFSCNHCPYVKLYEDRMVALNEASVALGYPVIAINPNDPTEYPDDSYENMIERARQKGFTFPYLLDASQETAKAYGAARTPHVFLLQKEEGEKYKVVYIGAIDDDTQGVKEDRIPYVLNAIDAVQKGEKPNPDFTKAIGCSIKWKK